VCGACGAISMVLVLLVRPEALHGEFQAVETEAAAPPRT